MNVFVLCTGRCGSVSIIEASRYITNYTAGHESRRLLIGKERLNFPANHIEADNRLTWLLGRLDQQFGNNAFYVHLSRDRAETAKSFNHRWELKGGIIRAYAEAILCGADSNPGNGPTTIDETHPESLHYCEDYCDTVNANIELFLRDKTQKMNMRLETICEDYKELWKRIGAKGDLEKALASFDTPHNTTAQCFGEPTQPGLLSRTIGSIKKKVTR